MPSAKVTHPKLTHPQTSPPRPAPFWAGGAEFDPAAMPVGATEHLERAWIERTGDARWIIGPMHAGRPAAGVNVARSPERARHYMRQISRYAPAGADRHLTNPQTLRLDAGTRAWYAEAAAAAGVSTHALMVRALEDFRAAHSLAPIAGWAEAPAE